MVRQGKKATHKCFRVEGGFSGTSKFQGPVSKPNSVGCNGQLNSGGLQKKTRRNSLSRDIHSPVEGNDLVLSLPDNLESQTHSRVSKCDGRSSVQVKPSAVNRMVTGSTGVQTDLSKVVPSSCRSICHSSEPQTFTVRVPSPRPKCLGHRCSKHKLVRSNCLCLPSDGSPSQGDPKNQAMQLPDHCNSPRLARDALVLGPCAALNRDPTSTTSVNNSSQTVPQLCVSQQSTTSQLPHLVSRSGQLQEQGFSLEVADAPRPLMVTGQPSLRPWAQLSTIFPKAKTLTGCAPVFTGIVPKVPGIFQNGTFLLFLMNSPKHPLRL